MATALNHKPWAHITHRLSCACQPCALSFPSSLAVLPLLLRKPSTPLQLNPPHSFIYKSQGCPSLLPFPSQTLCLLQALGWEAGAQARVKPWCQLHNLTAARGPGCSCEAEHQADHLDNITRLITRMITKLTNRLITWIITRMMPG